jgi:aryl-alcohol dehydrogenase-like predicted oxidoreductase
MTTRQLGKSGPTVSSIALGAMGMSGMYGTHDEAESVATIQAAVDAGVNLIDTGDFYGAGHNELLISRALEGRRNDVLLSVKFGPLRAPSGAFIGIDCRPAAVKNFAAYSLQRLKTDHIDIYRPARLDPQVPIEDTIGAVADLVKAGHVRYIGLSEVGAATIRRAQAVHPVADLQIEYSLLSRGIEKEILPVLRELGIGVTAYGVLSRGLLSGTKPTAKNDFRNYLPRFKGENYEKNRQLAERLAAFAKDRGASASQVAIAWVLAQGMDIVPVVGSRKQQQLTEALGAENITLTPEDVAQLNAMINPDEVAGARYDPGQMRALDSER